MHRVRVVFTVSCFALLLPFLSAQVAMPENPGLTTWKSLILAMDSDALAKLYAVNPPATGPDGKPQDLNADKQYWNQFVAQKPQGLGVLTRGTKELQGLQVAALTVSFKVTTPEGPRTRYILVQQFWQQQGADWRIIAAKHSAILKMPQPTALNPNLYPKNVDAHEEIKDAVARAAREHKRVILVFGANWCYDCHVLDFALHNSDAAPIAEHNFIVVHVDIGDDGKLNADVVKEYNIPLDKGVPALAVLDRNGKLLYAQQNGEFESARSMDPDDLIAFLSKWKP